MKKEIILKIIGILLLIGGFADLDYSYYQILRWYISILFIYLTYIYYQNKEKEYWIWFFGIFAIIFNPIAPIYFGRELWLIIDLSIGVIIFISLFFIDYKIDKSKN